MVKLSVLDYAHLDEDSNSKQALRETVELAQHAEKLGYHRFWMAEHHDLPAFSSSSPEMIMMKLADETESIQIGSGGVMIPHYSPYKIAENFSILEGYHEGRINLGIGNTLGTDIVKEALNETKEKFLSYEGGIRDIQKFLTNEDNPDHRFNELMAYPEIDTFPEMFVLSSSVKSAKMAARLGVGYTFGLFPYASKGKQDVAKEAIETYRNEFKPSVFNSKPTTMLSVFVAVSDDKEQADKQKKALQLWLLGKNNFGALKRFPSYETAENYEFTEKDQEILERNQERVVFGHIDEVEAELREMLDYTGADEMQVIPLMSGIDNRKKALDLLYERLGS